MNETTAPGSIPVVPSPMNSPVVLVVESDSLLRTIYARILETNGHRVLAAGDGYNALVAARGHEGAIDLLVANAGLPRMSGPDIWRKLANAHPGVRVLFLTGRAETPVRPLEPGTTPPAVLARPFTPEELLATVRRVLAAPPAARPDASDGGTRTDSAA